MDLQLNRNTDLAVYSNFMAQLLRNDVQRKNQVDQECDYLKSWLIQQLSKEKVNTELQFITDLQQILQNFYPNCKVYPFGSSITGLYTSDSDLDIFVDVYGDQAKRIGEDPLELQAVIQLRDNVSKIIQQSVCPNTKIKFAENIQEKGDVIPYLKFYHTPTKLECDLTFGHLLSVQSSRLIQFYMNLEPRIKPYLLLLLNWKSKGHVANVKFRKYSFIVLSLVHLMEINIIPSISFLQSSDEPFGQNANLDLAKQAYWNGSFCNDIEAVKAKFSLSESEKTATDLVLSFWEMVANTNFANFVVCPQLGKILPKSKLVVAECGQIGCMNEHKTLCEHAKLPKLDTDTAICVQDFFMLNDNLTSYIEKENLSIFQNLCKEALVCAKQISSNPNEKKWTLDFLR